MTYDIFASRPSIKSPDLDPYTKLLLQHSEGCAGDDPSGETDAKKELKNLLVGGPDPFARYDPFSKLGLDLLTPDAVNKLPHGAVQLSFTFTLAKTYLSRDDSPFFPTDNPLRRDHVFKVPMVAASTWKGCLRAAAVECLLLSEQDHLAQRLTMLDLFGDEKTLENEDEYSPENTEKKKHKLKHFLDKHAADTKTGLEESRLAKAQGLQLRPDELHNRGRLFFFPSWFPEGAFMDVLNPRDRKKRTGTIPIALEAIKTGSESTFTLLYFPFDLLGRPREIPSAQKKDWKLIGEALFHMLCKSGFGAKKSSGCGATKYKIRDLILTCNSTPFVAPKKINKASQLPQLHEAFNEAL